MHRVLVAGHNAALISDAELYDALRTHTGGGAIAGALALPAASGTGTAVVDYATAAAAEAATQRPLYIDGVQCRLQLLGRSLQAEPTPADVEVVVGGFASPADPAAVFRMLQPHMPVLGVASEHDQGGMTVVVVTTADGAASLPYVLRDAAGGNLIVLRSSAVDASDSAEAIHCL